VRRYLPDASTHGTVRQLLGHSAGCAAHVEFFRRLRVEGHADPRAVLVDRAQRERCAPPGVAAVYSDLGFIQLGAVLERAGERPLEELFATLVAEPLGLTGARYAPTGASAMSDSAPGQALENAVATELDDRGLVCGLVHDENCYFGGGVAGHAGLFADLGDVATWAAAMVSSAAGAARGRFDPDTVRRFFSDAPIAGASWRLGWDTPSSTPGVSQAGDRWPRTGAVGHTGYTGTSVWLDLANRRWVVLLANRVHPTRHGNTADAIKALRRAVGDAVIDSLS
jgi:CubicO group peptidase (beta-lactamase class C family)